MFRIAKEPSSLAPAAWLPEWFRWFAQGALQRATAGVQMASAAQPGRDAGNVQVALAAQREPHATIGQLAQQNGRLNAAHADRVIHDAFAILLGGSGADHVVVRHPQPGKPAFTPQVRERRSEQQHL